MRRLLLLGGGHAHLQVLAAFVREPLPATQVLLVSPCSRSMYTGMLPGLVAGHYASDDCVIPLAPLAERARARFIEGTAQAIDAANRIVHTGEGALHYDLLSIDTGATMARDAIPGAREHGLFVRPVELFAAAWPALAGRANERLSSVVMIGGGAAGVELSMAIRHALGASARVSLVTGGVPPMAGHTRAAQRCARRALKRRGVMVFEDTCTQVAADHVLLGRGAALQCDAALLALGASAPEWLAGSGIALDEQGFVATGPTLQSTSHPAIFAAGDVASRIDTRHARSGVYAVRAGEALALNLRRFAAGGALVEHRPQRCSLNLLSCGDRRAIASWGPFAAEGRWAWRWKDRIDRAWVARFATLGP